MSVGRMPVAILVADGDELVRMVTADMLADAGFAAIEVRTAAEALAVLERPGGVRLVITARMLPGALTGIQLAHRVRARWPQVGLIVTAGATIDMRRDLPPGAHLLRKPYDFAELMRQVEAELEDAAFEADETAASAMPLVPDASPLQTGAQQGLGAGALATPVTEPDKS